MSEQMKNAKTYRLRCQKKCDDAHAALERARDAVEQAEAEHAAAVKRHEDARAHAAQLLANALRSGTASSDTVDASSAQDDVLKASHAMEAAQRAREALEGEWEEATTRLAQAKERVSQAAAEQFGRDAAGLEQQLRDSAALTSKLYHQLKAYAILETRVGVPQILSPTIHELIYKMDPSQGVAHSYGLGREPWVEGASRLHGEFQQMIK